MNYLLFLRDLVYGLMMCGGLPYYIYRQLVRGKDVAGLDEKFGAIAPRKGQAPCIWLHGVSVGETLAGAALYEKIRTQRPDWDIVISSSTATGFEVAGKKFGKERVFYYPFDFSWIARKALRTKRPDAIVLMEFEVWPNMVDLAAQYNIPVIVVNGRITEKALRRMKKARSLYGGALNNVTRYCMQNETYASRIREMGVSAEHVEVTGSMKFDAVLEAVKKANRTEMRKNLRIGEGERLIIGGSTHEGEERALIAAFQALRESQPHLRLLLAPRHPERLARVGQLLGVSGLKWSRKTELGNNGPVQVILLDTMGELVSAYAAADAVFIGGSLIPHGGQNPLEASALGHIPIFGPSMWNFADIVEYLSSRNACRQISGRQELSAALMDALAESHIEKRQEVARRAVLEGAGATEKNLNIILNSVDNRLKFETSLKGERHG